MSRIRKFLDLDRRRRVLLVLAAAALCVVRCCLSLLRYRTVLAVVERAARRRRAGAPAPAPASNAVIWAVRTAARHIPFAGSCLCQALAAKALLGMRGCPCQLQIGVAKGPADAIQAHAWLISGNSVIIGGPLSGIARYTVLDGPAAIEEAARK